MGTNEIHAPSQRMNAFHPEQFLILVVDDIYKNLQLMIAILEKEGYKTTFARNGQQAIERVISSRPHLILLDLMMPGMGGLDICAKIKKNPDTAHIPIVFLTASDNKDHLLQAFAQGAVDYIMMKPCHPPEILARVKTHLTLQQMQRELRDAYDEMKKLATQDPLTGVANRRVILEWVEEEFLRSQRYQTVFSVLMVDIDYFKRINDNYGHDAGDEVLRSITATTQLCVRKVDRLGRMGGEEFLLLLPETNLERAEVIANRIRETIETIAVPFGVENLQVTLSIGCTAYLPTDQSTQAIIDRADRALFHAKGDGRNRVNVLENDNL